MKKIKNNFFVDLVIIYKYAAKKKEQNGQKSALYENYWKWVIKDMLRTTQKTKLM